MSLVQRVDSFYLFQELRVNCRFYIFTSDSCLVFTTQIVKYIFSAGKIKETFYQAKVVCVVLFYDSVCLVQAT